MTYEYAAYFRLLLLCGYSDELQQYVDKALVEEEPLSDVVLELVLTGANDRKKLSVLNEYLRQTNDSDIDYDNTVFDYVMSFLKRKYIDESMSLEAVTELMYRFAIYTGRWLYEPWNTMEVMSVIFDEAKEGYCISIEEYQKRFEKFINDKVLLSELSF